jgi:hypothetical protein
VTTFSNQNLKGRNHNRKFLFLCFGRPKIGMLWLSFRIHSFGLELNRPLTHKGISILDFLEVSKPS